MNLNTKSRATALARRASALASKILLAGLAMFAVTTPASALAATLSIADARINEGNSGTTQMTFTVSLSAASASAVTFHAITSDGTASGTTDYTAVNLAGITIAAGQTSTIVSVSITGDTVLESNETIGVTIDNASGATIADGAAVGQIVNDDGNVLVSAPLDPSNAVGSNGPSHSPSVSVDGRYVAFASLATNMTSQPAATFYAIFVRDMQTGTTGLASPAVGGGSPDNWSSQPSISAGGRFVAFHSKAHNLVSAATPATDNIYLRDVQLGTTALVSTAVGSVNGGNAVSEFPSVSADGRYVAFHSSASNLVASDPNGSGRDVFVRDMQTGITTLVSIAADGTSGANDRSDFADISADGRYVVFSSSASNLVANDNNATGDVFMRDMQTGVTSLVSVKYDGDPAGGGGGGFPTVSSDGRFVAFSGWGNLVAGDTAYTSDIYVRDMQLGTTKMVGVSLSASAPHVSGFLTMISDDGRYVAFGSFDSNLAPNDFNFAQDVFVADVQTNSTVLIDRQANGTLAAQNGANHPTISGDGRYVVFDSLSADLLIGDNNSSTDVLRAPVVTPFVTNANLSALVPSVGTLSPTFTSREAAYSLVVTESTSTISFIPTASASGATIKVNGALVASGTSSGAISVPAGDSIVTIVVTAPDGITSRTTKITVSRGGVTPSLSIGDVSISEGNSGSKVATFTISLSGPASSQVAYYIETADGSAISNSDYGFGQNWQSIPAGSTSTTFDVTIYGDAEVELDETFTLNIAEVSGATVADGQAVGTIINDDSDGSIPGLSIGDVSISEGNSGTKVATFTVTLSAASPTAVTYNIATANGTATSGSDYVAASLTGQSIAAGSLSKTFAVTINGDTIGEANETFAVNVTGAVGATVADGQAVGTINNDDSSGALPTLSIADVSITEGNSGTKLATFTVTLSAAQTTAVYFDIGTYDNGSAFAGQDYVLKMTDGMRVARGATSRTFTVTIVGDTSVEEDETFRVILSNPVGATIADSEALGTITNDDTAPAYLSIANVSLNEGDSGTKAATFTVSLSAPSSAPVSFDIATQEVNTTATVGSDYVSMSLVDQTIPAGQTSKTFDVTINGDTTIEENEFFFVTVRNIVGAAISQDAATGIITNDDFETVPQMSINDQFFFEGTGGTRMVTFSVHLSGPAASTVTFDIATADGTAVAGSDYQTVSAVGETIAPGGTEREFTVEITPDAIDEQDEIFYINISNVSGANLVKPQGYIVIGNDDTAGTPTLSITDASVVEGNTGSAFASFTVTLSAPATADVTFNASTSDGSATANSDYIEQNWGLVFHPGSTTLILQVPVTGDTTQEPDETFTINLSNVVGATVADGSGVGTINDDDSAGLPTLSIADVSIAEGNGGQQNLSFTATLSAPSAQLVTFDFATADGTAISGQDYEGRSSAMFISAGATSTTFSVLVNGDATVEPNETFTLALSNVVGATVVDGSATATIINDDAASGPTLSIGNISITEGDRRSKTATFTVSLSAASSSAITYNIATANGSALAGSDYVAKSLNGQSIPAGSLSKTFSMAIKGDTTAEPDETFLVDVSNVVGATVADGQAVGTIINDDGASGPTLSITDASVVEGNSGSALASFTVTLSAPAAADVTFNASTSDGSATANSDYIEQNWGLVFHPGSTTLILQVPVTGDTTQEPDETFSINLSNVVGASVADGSAVGTISNDDGGGSGPTLSIGDISITEGNSWAKQATFTITLSAAASSPVTYNIATANGTAIAGSDYVAKSLTGLSIPTGSTSKTFSMAIKGDTGVEPNETFLVNVSNVAGATVADGQAVGTIVNDDGAGITIASLDAGALFDDLNDGNGEPERSADDYAAGVLAQAKRICGRADAPMLVAVEGVENLAVLQDIAMTANDLCSGKPGYAAVLKSGNARDNIGLLVATLANTRASGARLLSVDQVGKSARFRDAQGVQRLLFPQPPLAASVLVDGLDSPLTVVMVKLAPATDAANAVQSRELATWLRARMQANPAERLVLLTGANATGNENLVKLTRGAMTAPAMRAATSKPISSKTANAGQVLVSQNLLADYPKMQLVFDDVLLLALRPAE